jgi:hypothetical protein
MVAIAKEKKKKKVKAEVKTGQITEAAPIVIQPLSMDILMPNYEFSAEVQKDWKNEKRLLFGEIAVISGIIIFAILRAIVLNYIK